VKYFEQVMMIWDGWGQLVCLYDYVLLIKTAVWSSWSCGSQSLVCRRIIWGCILQASLVTRNSYAIVKKNYFSMLIPQSEFLIIWLGVGGRGLKLPLLITL
jgi:hypothetical protein